LINASRILGAALSVAMYAAMWPMPSSWKNWNPSFSYSDRAVTVRCQECGEPRGARISSEDEVVDAGRIRDPVQITDHEVDWVVVDVGRIPLDISSRQVGLGGGSRVGVLDLLETRLRVHGVSPPSWTPAIVRCCGRQRASKGDEMDRWSRCGASSRSFAVVVLGLLCVLALSPAVNPDIGAQDYESRRSATPPAFPEPNIFAKVPMRDGVKLATSILLPETEGPHPTILVRTVYKDGIIPVVDLRTKGVK
jgi:hypothetical protein